MKEMETSALADQAASAVMVCPSTVTLLQLHFCDYTLEQTYLPFSNSILFFFRVLLRSYRRNTELKEYKDSKYFKDRANSSKEESYWKKKDSTKDKEWLKKS